MHSGIQAMPCIGEDLTQDMLEMIAVFSARLYQGVEKGLSCPFSTRLVAK